MDCDEKEATNRAEHRPVHPWIHYRTKGERETVLLATREADTRTPKIMKLDRNITNPRRGKYALIKLRNVALPLHELLNG